jgi:orotate phosphoribosyltransferase
MVAAAFGVQTYNTTSPAFARPSKPNPLKVVEHDSGQNQPTNTRVMRAPIRNLPKVISHGGSENLAWQELSQQKYNINFATAFVRQTVRDGVLQRLKENCKKFNPILVAVMSVTDNSGQDNLLPFAYAQALADYTNLRIDPRILKINKAKHTGASAIERLFCPSIFDGLVIAGEHYILVDDRFTTGGTLADLHGFITKNGGNVVAVTTLTSNPRSDSFQQSLETREGLTAYPNFSRDFRKVMGFGTECLTNAEARLILTGQTSALGYSQNIRDLGVDKLQQLRQLVTLGRGL